MALTKLWFQTSSLEIYERINFSCFQPTQFVVICYDSARKLVQTQRLKERVSAVYCVIQVENDQAEFQTQSTISKAHGHLGQHWQKFPYTKTAAAFGQSRVPDDLSRITCRPCWKCIFLDSIWSYWVKNLCRLGWRTYF